MSNLFNKVLLEITNWLDYFIFHIPGYTGRILRRRVLKLRLQKSGRNLSIAEACVITLKLGGGNRVR